MSMAIGAIGTQAAGSAGLGGGFSGGYSGARTVRYGGAPGNAQQLVNGLPAGQGADGAARNSGGTPKSETTEARNKRLGEGCRTCAQRTYQDGSSDPGVSFKSPTAIRPEAAGSAVMAHEQEHVSRNQARAAREDRVVLSQSVTLHTGICSECHRSYISGGTTRTTTAAAKQRYEQVMAQTGASGNTKHGASFAASA